MNVRPPASAFRLRPPAPRTTRAANGLPRRAFTVTDVERMYRRGILQPNERIELIGGELVPMAAKGIRHEVLKLAILRTWMRHFGGPAEFLFETTLRISDDTFFEPDLIVFPTGLPVRRLTPGAAILVVEFSETSLRYDLRRKAAQYAAAGLRELWVIDMRRLQTHVLLDPSSAGYRHISVRQSGDSVAPAGAPALALRLNDLDLGE